ncbi:MAG: hypothetical protein AW09_002126 [Candidatus Accumulibacter phosphatis]|uniref:Histone deacetylase domain-containing protein n=2 Tax=Candidatus Accumulibacter TaxID=327159 RepID=A0A080LVN6_9PROT|nr:MAG: hypothetical protein AW09_002126 [Candidatus Accumulibacter phosphatis]MBL8407096.1 hypothetical protein [Accumulibacter sp.]NMQ05701.1 hypothetical protein [Candidatus Accumulibacter contiguus]
MAIALEKLRNEGKIRKALVLDIDLHFSDGTVDILDSKGYSGGGRLRRPAGLLGGILIHPGVVANDRAVCRSVRHDRWR